MEESMTLRKSCDFCYRRRIKCDGQKPRCSHCITYMTDCTFTAPSRKSRPKKRRNCATNGEDISNTQVRLQHLEALLEQVTERLKVAEKHNELQPPQTQLQEESPIDTGAWSTTTPSTAGVADHNDHPAKSMFLPPLQQVLPIVQIFLEKFNGVLPLFNAKALLHLIHDFYHLELQQRDPVAWAAINVVLALTYRQGLVGSINIKLSVEYLTRAESVLSDVLLGDIHLLNIQVLVGMVVLLQASQDLQPSLILIGTTMRLAHKIGLHDRASSVHLDPADARQHACVFWMAYILDKDLSLRTRQPSIQLDDDIDLDLPSPEFAEYQIDAGFEIDDADSGVGHITTSDGNVRMNYFEARIQLAVIEGGVYDFLFSTRSQKHNTQVRARALESVACALEKWKASIPPEFNASTALKRVPPDILRFLGILHSTSLMCTTFINEANAGNPQWVDSIRMYAKDGTMPQLPRQWETLVDEARDLVVLLEASPATDRWNFWITGCPHLTAIMLLKANSVHNSQYDKLSLDSQLVEAGLRTLGRIVEETQSEMLRSFQATCAELNQNTLWRRIESTITAQDVDLSMHSEATGWIL